MSKPFFAPELTDQPWDDAVGYRSEYDGLRSTPEAQQGLNDQTPRASAVAPLLPPPPPPLLAHDDPGLGSNPSGSRRATEYDHGTASFGPRSDEENLLAIVRRRAAAGDYPVESNRDSGDRREPQQRPDVETRSHPSALAECVYSESEVSNPWADTPGKVHYHQRLAVAVDELPRVDSATFPREDRFTPKITRRARPLDLSAEDIPPAVEHEAQRLFVNDGIVRETKELRERWWKEHVGTSDDNFTPGLAAAAGTDGSGQTERQLPESETKPLSGRFVNTPTDWRLEDDPWRN